jgi:general secretion pathway protein C
LLQQYDSRHELLEHPDGGRGLPMLRRKQNPVAPRRLPAYAAWVLALLIVIELGHTVRTLWALQRPRAVPATPLRVFRPADAVSRAQRIASAHLFGAAPDAEESAAKQQRLLMLAGTIASDDPGIGFAILGDTLASARMYAVGSTIPSGGRLVQIYADRVILDLGGRQEILRFPANTLLGQGSAGLPASGQEKPGTAPEAAAPAQDALTALNAYPTWDGARFGGYRINPSPKARRELGVRADDMLVAVNGVSIQSPENIAEALRSGEGRTTVTVQRGGELIEIRLRQQARDAN